MKTYYEILGVSPAATQEEIKLAYRKRAQETHPDKGGSDAAFQEVSRAYETLSNPEKRAEYDENGMEDSFIPTPEEALVVGAVAFVLDNAPAFPVFLKRNVRQLLQTRHRDIISTRETLKKKLKFVKTFINDPKIEEVSYLYKSFKRSLKVGELKLQQCEAEEACMLEALKLAEKLPEYAGEYSSRDNKNYAPLSTFLIPFRTL